MSETLQDRTSLERRVLSIVCFLLLSIVPQHLSICKYLQITYGSKQPRCRSMCSLPRFLRRK